MWWKDKRRVTSSLTALSKNSFTGREAEASYSHQAKCGYLTKVKVSPGQVQFNKLNHMHKELFRAARRKEMQSLLDNHAIRILSKDESKRFKEQFPDYVLKSRHVDRWKPDGDKFSVLPEEFDHPDFDPQGHGGLSPKSRWCVVGWMDPMVHEIERAAPTPLTASLYSVMQLSATRATSTTPRRLSFNHGLPLADRSWHVTCQRTSALKVTICRN